MKNGPSTWPTGAFTWSKSQKPNIQIQSKNQCTKNRLFCSKFTGPPGVFFDTKGRHARAEARQRSPVEWLRFFANGGSWKNHGWLVVSNSRGGFNSYCYNVIIYLVGGFKHDWIIFHFMGCHPNPIDELHHFSEGLKPPTRWRTLFLIELLWGQKVVLLVETRAMEIMKQVFWPGVRFKQPNKCVDI